MIIELLRVMAGLILILFIPGYVLTWVFFPRKQDITGVERLAYSFALSISGVMLSVLFVDMVLGVDTRPVNVTITILALTLLSFFSWKIHLFIINKEIKQKAIIGIFVLVNNCKNGKVHLLSFSKELKHKVMIGISSPAKRFKNKINKIKTIYARP